MSLTLLTLSPAANASYIIDKVNVNLSQRQFIDTLKITNPMQKPADIQTQVVTWTQSGGKEVYAPTSDLIVSPPIMKIAPKRTQLLRVGWRSPAPIQVEKAYRLFLQEITPNINNEANTVRVKLRMGLPVFIAPSNPVYQLVWSSARRSGNSVTITATATGNAHVQLTGATLTTSNGDVVGESKGSLYLFPKESAPITFTLTKPASGTLTLIAQTDIKTMKTTIAIP